MFYAYGSLGDVVRERHDGVGNEAQDGIGVQAAAVQ